MTTFKSKALGITLAVLLCLAFASPVLADKCVHKKCKHRIDWEILVDAEQEIAFFANNADQGISTDLFAPFVPGSTYWIKGNLYPAGSVNPSTFQVDECKKIGEWYCTGTRVRNLFDPLQQGELFEEANFTYRLNNGDVILTKQQLFFGEPSRQHVFFSDVKGVKAGDILTNDDSLVGYPRYILVKHVRKLTTKN